MDAFRNFFDPFLNVLGEYLPSTLGALILLVAGWIVIELLTGGLGKLLNMLKIDQRTQVGEHAPPLAVSKVLTRLFRYVLLLCLLLLVLDVLGVRGVLDPVRNMFDKFLTAVPHVVAGLLIAIIGYIIARMLAGVVTAVLSGVDRFNTRIGLSESFSLARFIGSLVFIFTFVPILIAALDVVKLESVSVPATEMLKALLLGVPSIVAAALILAVAFFVGRFVANMVSDLLKNLGADGLPGKIGLGNAFSERFTLSKLVGGVLLFFILLAAAISAVERLEMHRLSDLLSGMTQFTADIALGIVILAFGGFLAKVAHRGLSAGGVGPVLAGLARVAIIALVVAMGLRAIGIADDIVRMAFGFAVGGVAIAFALAFGLGGREAAGKQLEAWFEALRRDTK